LQSYTFISHGRYSGQEIGSFGFAKGRLAGGANQMCHLRDGRELFLKNAGGKKIKNKGSAMSACLFGRQFGLLVVRLINSLYADIYLSKLVVYLCPFDRCSVVF
jgi:hypothetical protein